MEVLNGKPYATLTDVKNLIGDVFAMADRHGEIVITSYNKPKYKLIRLSRDQISESIPAVPLAEIPVASHSPVAVEADIKESSAPVENVEPLIAAPLSENVEAVTTEFEVTTSTVQSEVEIEETKESTPTEPLNLDFSEWDRLSLNELNWVNGTRKLI